MKKNILILVSIFFIKIAHCQTYQLSNSFGVNGIVQTENISEPKKTIITPDNKILTIGYHLLNSPNPNLITHSFLLKLNQNGTPDQMFGNNGLIQTNIDYKDTPYDVVFQNDGKILLGGSFTIENPLLGVFPNSPYIARYSSNGIPDYSFADNGILKITNFNSITSTNLCSIVPQNDGKIIVGISGNNNNNNFFGALVKLTSNGVIDTNFGTNGILTIGDSNFKFNLLNLLLTDDNKFLLCGYDSTISSNPKTAIIKLNLDGSYDTSFANNGKLITDINISNSVFEYLNKISKSPDGNYICGGYVANNYLMIKFNLNGQFIDTFGNNRIFQNFSNIQDFYLQNSNIFLGGVQFENDEPIFKIICLNENGTINTNFNTNGYLYLNPTNQQDILKSFILDNQSSIIMSGNSGMLGNYNVTHAKVESENLNNENFWIERVEIFPNPFNNSLNIDNPEKIKSIEFYDYLGKKINIEYSSNFSVINTENLKKGIYLCKITCNNGKIEIKKLIKH